MRCSDRRSPRSQRAVGGGRVAEQFHDSEFVKGVLQCVVRLAVGAVSGKQPKDGLHAVAAPQPPRGIQGRISGDVRVIGAVGGKRHDVVPAEGGELGQMGAVEVRVVGKHLLCTVGAQAGEEIVHRLFPGRKGVFVLAPQDERRGVHAAFAEFGVEDIVFCFHGLQGGAVGNDRAERHDAVAPRCFCIDDGKAGHFVSFFGGRGF